jgi:hypothetical protein
MRHHPRNVGMSEDSGRSVVSMLAEQGKMRIAVVELPNHN